MKYFVKTLLIILICCDLALLYQVIFDKRSFLDGPYIQLALLDLIIGPIQFITAIILIFQRQYQTKWMYTYIIIAITLISILIGVNFNNEPQFIISYYILTISYVIAHLYTPLILSTFPRKNPLLF